MLKWLKYRIIKVLQWFKPQYKIVHEVELPECIKDKTIYIIGEISNEWLIVFKCPCKCQSTIHLNLLNGNTPCWNYSIKSQRKLTISPSIWRTKGCRSHFFVRKSKIDWIEKSSTLSTFYNQE